MKSRLVWHSAVVCLVAALIATARGQVTLRQAARGRFLVGTAIRAEQLDHPDAVALILKQFDCLTSEFEFMPSIIHPAPAEFNFKSADRIVAFAQAHKMPITGHMLVWNQMTPDWMFQDGQHMPLPREQALANLKLHIDTVMGHFKGRVTSWNVVNEALSDKPSEYLRDTPALRAIGPDYVQKAFEFAHAADPTASLYYNDYNLEQPAKLQKAIRLIRSLRSAGVRMDSIGLQGHWQLNYPDPAVIEAGIQTLGKEGLKVMITELDVDVAPLNAGDPYKDGLPPAVLDQEAERYAKLFEVFAKLHRLIPRVTFWGLDDGQSWLNYYQGKRTNYPLLFDRNLEPKPSYGAVIALLSKK